MLRKIAMPGVVAIVCLLLGASTYGQSDIFDLMTRRDLRLDEIQKIAKLHFETVGTGKGTGYKQFQRWLYEQKFHVDEQGYFRAPDFDMLAYKKGRLQMQIEQNAADEWTEMGPFRWNRTSGWNPGVGRITSLSVSPSDQKNIYITAPGGGVWRTTNGGTSWQPLTDANESWLNMYSVAQDPSNPNHVIAGTNGGILIHSNDGGANWSVAYQGMNRIWKLIFHPQNSQLCYAAANNGIYRSVNGGASWAKMSTTAVEDIEFNPGNPNIMYASGNSFLRSADGGQTWSSVTNGYSGGARTLTGVSAANPNVVYLVQASGSQFGKLYRSDNAGQSFSVMITGSSASCTNFFGYETSGCGTGGQAGYDMGICVADDNADEVYIAGIIVWKSLDGGSSFAPMTAWSLPNSLGYNHADVHALEFVGGNVYSGSDGGIYRSTDRGDNWSDLSAGLGIRQFYRIANSTSNSTVFSGGAQDNGSSIYKSTGWIDWLGADGMDCLISPSNPDLQWGTSQNGSLYRTSNGGLSYSSLSEPATGNWVTPLAIESNSNNIYAGWNGVYKSADLGSTWTKLSGSTIGANVEVLAVSPSNPSYIYASYGSSLFVTTNGGSSWTTKTAPAIINALAVNPVNPSRIWIACNSSSNRIFVSNDGGSTWTNKSMDMPSTTPRTIAVDDDGEESIYVGANVGVYYTNNTMSGWVDLTGNLPKVAVNEVEIQQSGGILRIATYGRGVWERPLYGNPLSCNAPSGLITTNITKSSATLEWQSAGGALGYTVAYQLPGETTWNTVAQDYQGNSFLLNNLAEATTYTWRINSNCENGTSGFATNSFTTLEACPIPTNPATNSITLNGATVSWTAVDDADAYILEYKNSIETNWVLASADIATNSFTLDNLTPGTTYDWQVKSKCASASSTWLSAGFTTAAAPVCTDLYESNNSNKQAKSIGSDQVISANIDTEDDIDWFKISMGNDKNTNVRFKVYNLPADYDMYVYNKNMQLLGSSTNSGNSDEEVINNTSTLRMTYYVKVQPKPGHADASSCYNLVMETNASAWQNPAAPQQPASATTIASGASIRPNPANDKAILSFTSEREGFADVRIMTIAGVVHETFGITVKTGLNQVNLQTGSLTPGLYLVQVKNPYMRIIKQLLIVR